MSTRSLQADAGRPVAGRSRERALRWSLNESRLVSPAGGTRPSTPPRSAWPMAPASTGALATAAAAVPRRCTRGIATAPPRAGRALLAAPPPSSACSPIGWIVASAWRPRSARIPGFLRPPGAVVRPSSCGRCSTPASRDGTPIARRCPRARLVAGRGLGTAVLASPVRPSKRLHLRLPRPGCCSVVHEGVPLRPAECLLGSRESLMASPDVDA